MYGQKMGEAYYHFYHATDLKRIEFFADIICNNCFWHVGKNGLSSTALMTSDNPVLFEGEHTQLDHSMTDTIWPLSPEYILRTKNKAAHKEIYGDAIYELQYDEIIQMNCWQAQNCGRFVYSPTDAFEEIKSLFLGKYPQFRNLYRDRSEE